MIVQCDLHRRDHDKAVAARQIAHIKQAKRNSSVFRDKPATMAQARKRWSSHTKQVLSSIGRACASTKTVWSTRGDGVPVVTIGEYGAFSFAFHVSQYGHPYACQLPYGPADLHREGR